MIFPQQTIVRERAGRTSQFALPKVEGTMSVLSFLFIGHYGFLPDSEVPNGRLHPYVGVGPGIVFSGLDSGDFGLGYAASTNIALVAETGLRFFCLKNVSLDAAFRYRFFSPNFSHTVGGVTTDVNFDVNSFAFLFRANYHF
jgi:opacity protein-like surface antigen